MVGRVVRQLDGQTGLLHNVDDALHKLRASAMVFRAIVQIDDQRGDPAIPWSHRLPPLLEPIHQAITRHVGRDPVDKEFVRGWDQDTYGGHLLVRLKIMIEGFGRHAALAATGKGANVHRRFGVHRDPQGGWVRIRLLIHGGYVVENGVGLGDLFLGLALATLVGW